jgi:hypothetical protein
VLFEKSPVDRVAAVSAALDPEAIKDAIAALAEKTK